ncbi:MAG: HAMP domain-containing sensor histidine kinase, partial [Hydrogenophaga sp.]
PVFHLFVWPTLLPSAILLAISGQPVYLALSGLTLLFLFSMINYARVTNRLHRESMRLRFENQRLIGDLELRNADVENASRNKSLFLAGVSHDLKQPIRAIAMFTGFLRHSAMQTNAPDAITQTASKIESAVGVIHGQISRLLELSRLESGAMPQHLEWVDLDNIVAPMHAMLAPQAQARQVQLRLALGNPRQVLTDRRMLESILANLLSNAIKHATHRVYVGIRLRSSYLEGQRLCIEVRDDGPGIPLHQLPLLFDAYRSFDDRQASESHGLGLAIAKAQASHLGYEIDVRTQPGCGATFTLCGLRTLPSTERC